MSDEDTSQRLLHDGGWGQREHRPALRASPGRSRSSVNFSWVACIGASLTPLRAARSFRGHSRSREIWGSTCRRELFDALDLRKLPRSRVCVRDRKRVQRWPARFITGAGFSGRQRASSPDAWFGQYLSFRGHAFGIGSESDGHPSASSLIAHRFGALVAHRSSL